VEIIQKQSKRLSNIVTDILSLSDLENTDAKEIEKTDVEISSILDDIISLYQKKAEIKNLKIKKEAAADIKTIYANEFYLEQALINLIDNAIKYTEKGAIAIKVCAKNNFVQITVADTGLGIEQKHLPRLFDRFYVVDKSRSRASGGTGLGLAIVKHIAIVHNGFIEVESKVGKGSAFKMSLPLKSALDS
ncbi:MAG: GHKL domain-containing protein, partial [Elusimicrobiota bacterium]|nr:GHKL domain-containing protein [Elusimicrobiota bacterium]